MAGVRLTTWSLIFTVFNIGLSIGVVIAVGMLLYFQLRSIIRNRTGIEDWILDKAIYRRKMMTKAAEEAGDEEYEVEPFVYPYDLGNAKNVTQVMNFTCMPVGDGVNWPVVEGCDQYTLTVSSISTFNCCFYKFVFNFSVNNLRKKWKNELEHVATESSRKSPDLGCRFGRKASKFAFILR